MQSKYEISNLNICFLQKYRILFFQLSTAQLQAHYLIDYLHSMQVNNRQMINFPDDISIIEEQTLSNERYQSKQAKRKELNLPLGGMHINYILYFFIPLLIFACIFCYHEAVSKKQEKPFPHTTITNTACHYPQDIVFRYFMLPAGGFINLAYYCVFRWMQKEKKRTGYPGSVYGGLLRLSQISTLGFLAAIGTIDGLGYPIIHDIGAVFFFIILFVLSVLVTLIVRDMYDWDPSAITRSSYNWKTIFAGYLVLMAIYCIFDGLSQLIPKNDDDPVVVILQWNLVFFGLAWLMTFVLDWSHVFITLRGDISQTMKRITPQ